MVTVFMFPGQSSRYPGMLDKLVTLHAPNVDVLDEASDVLRRDLRRHYRADNPLAFERNVDVQVGVFLANHMFMKTLESRGVQADLSLGLSLGEYNHLVHIGALDFRDALSTVQARGDVYDTGPAGEMASLQPIDLADLRDIVVRARRRGVIEIANLNSPRQHVVSGERDAVAAAIRIAEEEYYAQGVVIERRIPMHSSMFDRVAARYRAHLDDVRFRRPRLPYLPNRLGCLLGTPTREQFVQLLSEHVRHPVLWRLSVDHVREHWRDATFVEVGPMSVLKNLMNRKWCRNRTYCTDRREGTALHLEQLVAELHRSADANELVPT